MRLFLAAPSDLASEREILTSVVDHLNAQNQAPSGDPRHLEVVDWSRTIAPLSNLPESVAFRNLEVSDDDIFVALSWLKFDAPETQHDGNQTCSERDFELAYNYWKSLRSPRGMFLRGMRLPTSLVDIDSRAFDRIGHFDQRFDAPEKSRFSYGRFQNTEELIQHLQAEIPRLMEQAEPAEAEAQALQQRSQLRGSSRFETVMEPGKAYEVSFLSIEIADWPGLVSRYENEKEDLQTLATAFLELVKGTATNYGGEIFSWESKGGLVMFWNKRSYDHAIMTGLKVLHNLPVFNLDARQNPLGENMTTRSSAHNAVIVFQLPIEEISSADINFVLALQTENTDAGELTLTRRLLERVDERLRPHFKFKERYEREPIYSCKLPSAKAGGEQASLEDFVSRLRRQTSLVVGLLSGPASGLDVSAADSVSSAVDETYSLLNKFCLSFGSLDSSWSTEFLNELADTAALMRREEASVWGRLRQTLEDSKIGMSVGRRLEALVRAAARRRSRSVVILEKLEQRCQSRLQGVAGDAPKIDVGEELLKSIDRLIRADELDHETALTDLLMHSKGEFLDYVMAAAGDERHAKLIHKLWETADLVLLDDLYSIRGHKRADEVRIFDALVHPRTGEGRFGIVRELLASPDRSEEVLIGQLFEKVGLRPDKQDLQIIWRCMVVGHPDEKVRAAAALKLTPRSMWQVVSHPSIPVASIHAIGERMRLKEGEDARKIFFDCVRSRLEGAVESFRSQEELNTVNKLILQLLSFSFLVETGYFERFDDILRRFLNQAQATGMKVDYFEKLRKTLEEARRGAGDQGPSKPPAGIKSLPLTIQRRLAGESRYIYWFVTHPDPRIACETLRHIGLMHVERVLRLREINGSVLHTMLRKPELFTRQQAILAALNHPKCTQEFATRYIQGMTRGRQGRMALDKIAQNPSASPVVRAAAKRAMASVQRVSRR